MRQIQHVRQYFLVSLILGIVLLWGRALPSHAQVEDITCTQDVIVQADDWLSKLSEKFFGDVFAYPAIAEATNRMATIDDSYATIEDVDLIEPGWKLCIVEGTIAEEILGFELDAVPTPAGNNLSNLTGVIKIGAAHAFSGPLAPYGEAVRAGIELAVTEINESESLGEARLQIVWQDTAGDGAQAAAAFTNLIETEDVVAILGPTLSRSAFVANPVAQTAGVPVIASSNVVEDVTAVGDYIFRTSFPERLIAAYTIQQAKSALDLQQVIILYDDANRFTSASLSSFEQALAAESVEIVARAAFSTGTPDFAAQLPELLTLDPDAILLIALPEDAGAIIAQARSLGLPQETRFIGGSSLSTPIFLNSGGEAIDGTLVGMAWHPAAISGASRQFVANFESEYGQLPDALSAQSYTAVQVLVAALRQANSTDRTALRDALNALEFVETPMGLFAFDENRNPTYSPTIHVVQNGAFESFP